CALRRQHWPNLLVRRSRALKAPRASIRAFILILRHRGLEIVPGGMQRREFVSAVIVTFAVGHAPSILAQRTGNVALGRFEVFLGVSAFVGLASCHMATQRQENSASHDGRPNTHSKPPSFAGGRAAHGAGPVTMPSRSQSARKICVARPLAAFCSMMPTTSVATPI